MLTFSLRMECLLPDIFRKFIYFINSEKDMGLTIPQWISVDYPNDMLKKSNIKEFLDKLLKKAYQKNPDICVDNVEGIKDINFFLKQNLNEIFNRHSKASDNPLEVAAGKAIIQTFFIECLLFAGKFTSHCISIFENEKDSIFRKVLNQLNTFFGDQHVYSWIKHFSQVNEPFGMVILFDSLEEKKELYDEKEELYKEKEKLYKEMEEVYEEMD